MAGIIATPAMTMPFFWIRVAIQPLPIMAIIWMAPKGILNRMVVKLLYPNDWTIKLPKVEMPPLAMLYKSC